MTKAWNDFLGKLARSVFAFCLLYPSLLCAQIQWEPDRTITLGRIPVRNDTLLVFPFRNLGSGPIHIDNVRTVCGCTMPEWSTAPILPGERGEVRVVFRPDRRGRMSKNLKVWFRGRNKPEPLRIEAQAY